MNFSASDLLHLAQYGGGSLALTLLLVLISLERGWLAMGRELQIQKEWAAQMRSERDAYRQQIEERQNIVDQAIELASLLKEAQARERERDWERERQRDLKR